MAMTDKRVCEAFDDCFAAIVREHLEWEPDIQISPVRIEQETLTGFFNPDPAEEAVVRAKRRQVFAHLLFIAMTGKTLIAEKRREKAMRWLGFLQGALWSMGVFDLGELKEMNKPKDAPTEPGRL